MAWKVKWSESAWLDLFQIAEYISKDSQQYAATFVRETREAARSLKLMPRRGRIVPEVGDPAIRELFVASFRLIYQVSDTDVFILALIHGKRDLEPF